MGKEVKISAIILYGGDVDEALYKKCKASIAWVDEVVIVPTTKIAGGFSEWRNWGANKAKEDWLFYVDTDEEISIPLKNAIKSAVSTDEFSAYAIPRKNIFLGHEMKYGGWSPDYVLRLIKKDKLKGWYGKLHEQPEIVGLVGKLGEPIIHTSHRSLSSMVDKTNEWSEIEARLLYESDHPKMNLIRFFTAGFREFWYRGFLKLGFLDGTVGVIEIVFQVFSRLITYSKLWEMQLNSKK